MLSTRPRLWNRKGHALNSVHGQPVKEVCALIRPSHSIGLDLLARGAAFVQRYGVEW